MKSISLFKGVASAFVISLIASLIFFTLAVPLSIETSTKISVAFVANSYIVFLISSSKKRTGRFFSFTLLSLITLISFLINLDIFIFSLLFVVAIWVVRSVYFYTRPLVAVLDFTFTFISLLASIGAIFHTQSTFLSFWSFLLLQAFILPLVTYILANSKRRYLLSDRDNKFSTAHKAADLALRKIAESARRG